MSEVPDQREIVRGLRRGDRDAWNALCQQYSSRVWRYVARLIGSDTQAVADVYQETMLAVATSGRSLADDTRLWAWLASIAHNQAALYWRKQYRSRSEAADLAQLPSDSSSEPAVVLARAELVEAVRRLLAELPADQVTLLTAKYLDGLSIAQMVDRLGGTTEGMRSRLARARREFRCRYQQIAQRHQAVEKSDTTHQSPSKGD